MTGSDAVDLSFIEAPEKRREAANAIRKLPPAVADAYAAMLYRHWDQADALLKLARDPRMTTACTVLAERVQASAAAYGGVRGLLVMVLATILWPPGAPSKAALQGRLNRRHTAAAHLRAALAALEHDDAVLRLSLPEVLRHGQQAGDRGIRDRATNALLLLHAADDDLEGRLMARSPTASDALSVLAEHMECDEPMHYAERTKWSVPVPQDGRPTRDKLWMERGLEAVFREFTGAPQYDCIADIEAAALGIDADAVQIKDRLAKAR